MSQRRRWILVDGQVEKRQENGRIVSFELRPDSGREFPAREQESKSNAEHERGKHIKSNEPKSRCCDSINQQGQECISKAFSGIL